MNVFVLLMISNTVLILAYKFYGSYLAKLLGKIIRGLPCGST